MKLNRRGIPKLLSFVVEKKNINFDFVDENSKDPLYYIVIASNCERKKCDNLSNYLVDTSATLLKQGLTYIRELEKGMHEHGNMISNYETKVSKCETKISEYEKK